MRQASADMKTEFERAQADYESGGTLAAKPDVEAGLRRATVDLFRGVRAAKRDYRQGIYRARRALLVADDKATADLELDLE
jgi:hypothetical protein